MSYLLETDRVIDWLSGGSETVALVRRIAAQGLAISLISYGEVFDGIVHGKHPAQRQHDFEVFLQFVDILPLTMPIMERFARERGRLRRQGQKIADMDLLIAATAIHHDLILITRNLRHFTRISGLQLYGDGE